MRHFFSLRPLAGAVTALLASTLVLSGCIGEPSFSDVPSISFGGIRKFAVKPTFGGDADSVVIAINFRDGDGDIGLTDAQRSAPLYNTSRNVQAQFFLRRNGVFQRVIRQSTPGVNDDSGYLFPLRDVGRGPIEGTIFYSITFPYSSPLAPAASVPLINRPPLNDTVYFRVQIQDRRLQLSNLTEALDSTPGGWVILNQR